MSAMGDKIYTGAMESWDSSDRESPAFGQQWHVEVLKQEDNSRLTLVFTDPYGMKQEVAVEVDGQQLSISAFSHEMDEALVMAKVGQEQAYIHRMNPDPSGDDYIKVDADGMNRASTMEFSPSTDFNPDKMPTL